MATLVPGLLWLSAQAAWGAEPHRWTVTPYLWLPTLNSELRFDVPDDDGTESSVETEIGPSDYLTNLNGLLMVAAEFRQERWTLAGDLVWLDITTDTSNVRNVTDNGGTITIPRETDLDTTTELSGAAVTLSAGLPLLDSDTWRLEALGGARWLSLDVDLDWSLTTTITGPGVTLASQGQASGDTDLYDGIVGARGRWRIGGGEHWYAPFYADVGTGSSDLTWQAMAGIGYAFERSSLLLVWRHLDYDDTLLREFRLDGPAFGFSWRF
jgi:hypothetical protein